MRHKDGRWLSILSRAFHKFGSDGEPERLVGTHVDITRRRLAETQLEQKSRVLTLLSDVAVSANEAVDTRRAMQSVIDRVCAFLDWPIGHAYLVNETDGILDPSPVWHLERPETFEPFRQITGMTRFEPGVGTPGRALQDRTPVWVVEPGDADFPRATIGRACGLVSSVAFPVRVDDDIVAIVEFFTDRRIEPEPYVIEALAQIGPQLGRVFERMRASADIVASKEDAERANKAKSDFLTNMSHELRTPLNAVVGFSEIITTAPPAEVASRYRRYAQDILASGRHLLDLITDLLDISKIEPGHFELGREKFALVPDLDNLAPLVAPQFQSRSLNLHVQYDGVDKDTVVHADRRALRQIVLNLLSNAAKFSHTGTSIDLRVVAAGNMLQLTVADHGVGIALEDIDRVFERFEQVRDPMGHRAGGTGIGLPLSRMLAEAHGGSLTLDSAVGVGTTATFILPECVSVDDVATAQTSQLAADADADAAADVGFSSAPRVLVAEDHPVNRSLMREILGSLGCQVELAEDGEQAVAAAMRQPFDLVLMDIQMPNMDGLEATRTIRELGGGLATMPIVALSANALPEHRQRSLAVGMNDHVSKPVTRADIARVLHRWVVEQVVAESPADSLPASAGDAETAGAPSGDDLQLDTAILDEFIGMAGAEKIAQLVDHLATDYRLRIAEMRTAAESDENEALRAAAHRLKGAFANLGGMGASALARDIEMWAREGGEPDPEELLARFTATADRTITMLGAAVDAARPAAPGAAVG
jgi:signal transduction histidine kinase/CheY-like chemotaxis protein/HPt (histidine-containing phosphotransfer) domain-containing protein